MTAMTEGLLRRDDWTAADERLVVGFRLVALPTERVRNNGARGRDSPRSLPAEWWARHKNEIRRSVTSWRRFAPPRTAS
jgi:hypothetical protein